MNESTSVTVLIAGMVAGLAVALPLGAIGALILSEGLAYGRRAALAAGSGVAVVDTVYCLVAVSVGTSVAPALRAAGSWPALVSGMVTISLGVHQWRSRARARPVQMARVPVRTGVFWRFVALTMVNPLTILYFLALAAGLAITDIGDAVAFVSGVGLASFGWQSTLAVIGSSLGQSVAPRTADGLNRVAAVIVIILGSLVATRALIG